MELDIWEFYRKKDITIKIRNIKEDLVRYVDCSLLDYVSAVYEIMSNFLINICWKNSINTPLFG